MGQYIFLGTISLTKNRMKHGDGSWGDAGHGNGYWVCAADGNGRGVGAEHGSGLELD